MNIFFLDPLPEVAAKHHCDQHCSKMMIEYAQLMSTAHRLTGSPWAEQCYKTAHKNHPSTIWTRESKDNYKWLYELWSSLAREFRQRRGKDHGSWTKLKDILANVPPALPERLLMDPPQCMPDEYKQSSCTKAYRAYYRGDKARFAKWEWPNSVQPWWWDEDEKQEKASRNA